MLEAYVIDELRKREASEDEQRQQAYPLAHLPLPLLRPQDDQRTTASRDDSQDGTPPHFIEIDIA